MTTGVEALCASSLHGERLTPAAVTRLLQVERDEAEPLFEAARELRRRHFGDAVFLYGFVYYSTYCRNSCSFCFYRAENRLSPRYRKDTDQVLSICEGLAEAEVNLLDLTLGEDPQLFARRDFSPLVETVARVSRSTGLPIMVSPGVLPKGVLAGLWEAGAHFLALYQETHDRGLFARLRLGQDFDERVRARDDAREVGLLVEDGILCGVGDSARDRVQSLLAMQDAKTEQVRAMTLVPQEQTPLANARLHSCWDELVAIAVMRLLMPDRLIPASLDIEGLEGLDRRLSAGANVVTSLVPPKVGLCGVANAEYEVDDGLRTPDVVREHLDELGLRQGTRAEFEAWLTTARMRRERLRLPLQAGRVGVTS
jgi:methylornithine synthase